MKTENKAPVAHNQAQSVPEGWKLVPIEPTEEMKSAPFAGAIVQHNMLAIAKNGLLRNWASMLAAAPLPPAAAPAPELTDAARDVLAERQRQQEVEGWSTKEDDAYSHSQLPRAAAAYAFPELTFVKGLQVWPWEDSWWKPKDARRNYVRAAALLLAEIERLDRAAAIQAQGSDAA